MDALDYLPREMWAVIRANLAPSGLDRVALQRTCWSLYEADPGPKGGALERALFMDDKALGYVRLSSPHAFHVGLYHLACAAAAFDALLPAGTDWREEADIFHNPVIQTAHFAVQLPMFGNRGTGIKLQSLNGRNQWAVLMKGGFFMPSRHYEASPPCVDSKVNLEAALARLRCHLNKDLDTREMPVSPVLFG